MRVVLNQDKFARTDASAVDAGLYMVIAKHSDGQRLIMNEKGRSLWVTREEMMISFRDATRYEIVTYFNRLRKSALANEKT